MPSLSFRDRFFSPQVARAVTSPSGILAFGAGAAAGVLAVGVAPVAVPVAIGGGLLAYGVRVALALPRKGTGTRIDPFAVNEPWRHAVRDAVQARNRFADAVKGFQPGPLKDSLSAVSAQMEEAVEECWSVAKQGQVLADARKQINDREARWELQQAQYALTQSGGNEVQEGRIAALEAQLATADRMDGLISSTKDQLDLLNARLDESVTRAIELSVSDKGGGAERLTADVGAIVDDLESLRRAIEEVDDVDDDVDGEPAPGVAPPPPATSP
ncbi:MAG: hypothetical protein KF703_13705 [Actinobacteria bacterium]|nr:hypothetical protein [Actinomycetota bacterium]